MIVKKCWGEYTINKVVKNKLTNVNMPIKNTMDLKNKISERYTNIFTSRPWNMYNPEDTTWWLVPKTDWPAFHLPKIIISKEKNEDNYFLGLYAEKGHGHVIFEINNSKKIKSQIMNNGWFWNKFCLEIKDEHSNLNQMVEKMSTYKICASVKLSYFNPERGEDSKNKAFESGVAKFLVTGKELELLFEKPNPENQDITKLIKIVSKCKNLSDVVDCINNFDKDAWTWCDFAIGIEINPTITEEDIVKIKNEIVEPIAEYLQTMK